MRLRPSGLPREVTVLSAVAFSVAIGFGIVAPALPLLARSFDVGDFASSAVISVFAFMRLISALGGGALVDRMGERRILAIGIGIVAVSSALAGAAPNYWALLLLRGVGGIGSAMFTVSAMSLLLRSVPPAARARAQSMFAASFLFGGILGPALGGLVTNSSPRPPFFIYAGTLTVAGTIGLLALPRTRLSAPVDEGGTTTTTPLSVALRNPAYRSALASAAAQNWAAFSVRISLIPLFVTATVANGGLGLDARWTGLGLSLSGLVNGVALVPAGRYADRRGRKPLLVIGLILLAISTALLALAGGLPLYLVSMVVFGPASALLSVAPAAIVGDVIEGRGGRAVAGFQMAGDFGSIVGPLLAGALADAYSYSVAFAVTAALLVVPLAVAVAAPETRRASEPDVATPPTLAATDGSP